jgi:hypothetical protein
MARDGVEYKRPLSCSFSNIRWYPITEPKLCETMVLILFLVVVYNYCACLYLSVYCIKPLNGKVKSLINISLIELVPAIYNFSLPS